MKWSDDCLSNGDLEPAVAGGGLRLDLWLIAPRRMSRPRSAPACSSAICISFSINLGRTISLESACEALTTVSTSNWLADVPMVAVVDAGTRSSCR
jgi:hypothetical protein